MKRIAKYILGLAILGIIYFSFGNIGFTAVSDCEYTVTFYELQEKYFIADINAPTLSELTSYYTHTDVIGVNGNADGMGYRRGALIPESRGKYIYEAQASAWYKIIGTNSGWPVLEFRYFAYDILTGERTKTFQINYQLQTISGHFGELREWKYSTAMPIDYELGPNEILGFYTVFHTHGANGIFYEFEYNIDSTQTPTYIDVWYSQEEIYKYYVHDCIPESGGIDEGCDLTPVLDALEVMDNKLDTLPLERGTDGASTHTPASVDDVIEDEEINNKLDTLSVQIEALKAIIQQLSADMGEIQAKLNTGEVITQKDLSTGQGGVFFMGAKKMPQGKSK